MNGLYLLLYDLARFNRDYTKWENALTDEQMHEAIQQAKQQHYVIGISSMLADGNCEVTFGIGDVTVTEAGHDFLKNNA